MVCEFAVLDRDVDFVDFPQVFHDVRPSSGAIITAVTSMGLGVFLLFDVSHQVSLCGLFGGGIKLGPADTLVLIGRPWIVHTSRRRPGGLLFGLGY